MVAGRLANMRSGSRTDLEPTALMREVSQDVGISQEQAAELLNVSLRSVGSAKVVIDSSDPTAFVLSANVHRPNLTSGQRAMATAFLYPQAEKGGRGKTSTDMLTFRQRVSEARAALRYSPDLAKNVLIGAGSLDEAYIKWTPPRRR